MNTQEFIEHTRNHKAPEATWPFPLQALWYAQIGEWDRAHQVTQQEDTPACAWVHAYLHREEGDLSNARYWYARAKQPESSATLDEERMELISSLLA